METETEKQIVYIIIFQHHDSFEEEDFIGCFTDKQVAESYILNDQYILITTSINNTKYNQGK